MKDPQDAGAIENWLDEVTNKAYSAVVSIFADKQGVFIVGGSLRDYFRGRNEAPKDLDVPVLGVTAEELLRIPGAKKDFFGDGVSINIGGMDVDVWPLQECFAIKHFGLPCDIGGLLAGAPFNLEKIAFDVRRKKIHDVGCIEGIKQKMIEYNPYRPYIEHIQALRLVLLKKKTQFRYGESAKALLVRGSVLLKDQKNWEEAVRFFNPKYGMVIREAKEEIMRLAR